MLVSRESGLLLGGIAMLLIGLAMLVSPARFIEIFWILIGIAVVLEACVTLFSVRPEIADPRLRKMLLIRSILGIAVGLVAVFLPLFIAGAVWAVMLYLLGIEMIASAAMELLVVRDLRALGLPVRGYVIESILLIALALALFIFPFRIGYLVVRLAGAAVIVAGAVALYRWKS